MSLQEQHDADLLPPLGATVTENALEIDAAAGFEFAPLGYWQQVWRRFKRDKVAIGGGISIILLFLVCFVGAPVFARILGHGPNEDFLTGGVTPGGLPLQIWAHFKNPPYVGAAGHFPTIFFPLGSDGPQGRDEFLRLLYGGRSTLEIAVGATLLALLIGTVAGTAGGFFGGATDALTSTATEFVAAFPLLLLVTALGWTISTRLNNVTLGPLFEPGVLSMICLIALFTWPYPARIVRQQVLALREREFVEASRMIGASGFRIVRTHLLPHLAATMIVYSTLVVAANIVLEAALSVLNFGLQRDIPDWGQMLQENFGSLFSGSGAGFATSIWTQIFPAAAILVTIVSLSLVGEALRQAADPRSGRRG